MAVLDLSDIFADAGLLPGTAVEGSHFQFTQSGDDTEVHVDVTGEGNFDGSAVVVLLNTDTTDLTPGGNVDV